jgi:hypothetical protein
MIQMNRLHFHAPLILMLLQLNSRLINLHMIPYWTVEQAGTSALTDLGSKAISLLTMTSKQQIDEH